MRLKGLPETKCLNIEALNVLVELASLMLIVIVP